MTTDPNVADPVKLAAIKDTLDRSGLAGKTAVSVEVGGKPFEMVFDSIMAGPRNAQPALAIEGENAPAIEPDREILGEFDDPPDDDDEIADYPPGIQRGRESESTVIDVEIVDAGYTEAPMTIGSDTTTPNDPDSSRSVDLGRLRIPARWVRPAQRAAGCSRCKMLLRQQRPCGHARRHASAT